MSELTFVAKISLCNSCYYCYFKAIMLRIFYEKVGFVKRKEKKNPKPITKQEKAQAYSRNLCEAHMPKASFSH